MTSLAELDQAIATCDPERRDETLARLTDAFLLASWRLGEPQVALFDHVMLGLVRASGEDARAALAVAIAPVPNAPLETTRHLALDDVAAVAAPILSRSTRIGAEALVDVATRRGPDHLMALAIRETIDPRWAEPLALRANPFVLHALRNNPAAKAAPGTTGPVDESRAEKPKTAPPDAVPAIDPREREAMRDRLEADLLRHVAGGEWQGVVAILATLAGIRPEPLLIALDSPQLDPLLVCMKAANLGWDLAESVFAGRFGQKATARLRAEAETTYARLTRDSAARAMRILLMKAKMQPPRAA